MIHLPHFSEIINSTKYVLFLGMSVSTLIDKKYLREYRCPSCKKLLAKGTLIEKGHLLEVKCRGCQTICIFSGEDVDIVKERSRLIKEGIISGKD